MVPGQACGMQRLHGQRYRHSTYMSSVASVVRQATAFPPHQPPPDSLHDAASRLGTAPVPGTTSCQADHHAELAAFPGRLRMQPAHSVGISPGRATTRQCRDARKCVHDGVFVLTHSPRSRDFESPGVLITARRAAGARQLVSKYRGIGPACRCRTASDGDRHTHWEPRARSVSVCQAPLPPWGA